MSVAFLPFTSLLLNQYFGSVSVIFYAPSMAATGLLLGMLWIYPARRRLLRNVEARLNRYYTLRALYPPADLPAIDSGRGAGPQAPEYAWILVFMGRPLLRRVAYR
ncbi:MAG TPA: hypothetical protein VEN95_08805 [Actinomycetota bacterium]|nr:hypothetical protein [Actinomycetota bacterium]